MPRVAPSAILAQTGLTGALSAITDDPDSPDLNWLVAASAASVDVRVGFPDQTLQAGAGLQEFRALTRRWSQTRTGVPTARLELWRNGALVRAGTNTQIPVGLGTVLSLPWNASELATHAGAECKVVGLAGGSGGQRNTIDVGAIEWNASVVGVVPVTTVTRYRQTTVVQCVNAAEYTDYVATLQARGITPATPSPFDTVALDPGQNKVTITRTTPFAVAELA